MSASCDLIGVSSMITLELSRRSEILMIRFVPAGIGREKSHTTGTKFVFDFIHLANVFIALDQQIFFDGYKYLSLKMLEKFTVF